MAAIRLPRGDVLFGTSKLSLAQSNQTKTNMKIILTSLVCTVLTVSAFAAETVTTTTTSSTGTGTITEYAPGSTFVIKETSGPVSYRYGKSVTYVTKSGRTLNEADVKTRIKVGAPVSVSYATEGEHRVISRVEVDDD